MRLLLSFCTCWYLFSMLHLKKTNKKSAVWRALPFYRIMFVFLSHFHTANGKPHCSNTYLVTPHLNLCPAYKNFLENVFIQLFHFVLQLNKLHIILNKFSLLPGNKLWRDSCAVCILDRTWCRLTVHQPLLSSSSPQTFSPGIHTTATVIRAPLQLLLFCCVSVYVSVCTFMLLSVRVCSWIKERASARELELSVGPKLVCVCDLSRCVR